MRIGAYAAGLFAGEESERRRQLVCGWLGLRLRRGRRLMRSGETKLVRLLARL